MSFDLYEYAGMSVICVLAFRSVLNVENYDYTICYSLKDTNMMRFLNAMMEGKIRCSYYRTCNHVGGAPEHDEDASGPFLHKRRKTEERFSDHSKARTNLGRNKTCTVIEMPFTRLLYEKAVITKESDDVCILSQEEIHHIFKYIYTNLDSNTWITRCICMSLQKNPNIFFSLSEYHKNCSILRKCHGSYPFHGVHDFSDALKQFRDTVNSSMQLSLTDGGKPVAYLYGNRKIGTNNTADETPLDELKVAFLFKYLDVEFEYLRQNVDRFYDKFKFNNHSSKLTIFVDGSLQLDSAIDLLIRNSGVEAKLSCICTHELSAQHHVERITCKFSGYFSREEMEAFRNFDLLKKLRSVYYVVDVVGSTLSPIKTIGMCLWSPSSRNIRAIPGDVTDLKCDGLVVCGNLLFKKQFESITWRKLIIRPKWTVTFVYGCRVLKLFDVTGRINLSGIAGLRKVLLYKRRSQLCFHESRADLSISLRIRYAKINNEVAIDHNVDEICFQGVASHKQLTIAINNATNVDISKSSGRYHFQGNVSGTLRFTLSTVFQVKTNQNFTRHFELAVCCISTSIVIIGEYDTVTLHNVDVKSYAIFTVNSSCRNLVIRKCRGTFALSISGPIDNISIEFPVESSLNFMIGGSISTNSLTLFNISERTALLSSLLDKFSFIKHLRIGRLSKEMSRPNLEEYLMLYSQTPPHDANLRHNHGNDLLAWQAGPGTPTENELATTHNEILSAVFHKLAVTKIESLEYHRLWISTRNCHFLRELPGLKNLTACVEDLTNETFACLPKSIRLLNISGSYINNGDWEIEPLSLNALKTLPNLEVFIIDDDFLKKPARLSFLPPCVEILVVMNCKLNVIDGKIGANKIRLCKLYISASFVINDDEIIEPHTIKFDSYFMSIFNYVDREYLEELFYITSKKSYQMEPSTLRIVNEWNVEYDLGIANN
ncbi:hypothetical protein VCUG_00965 [Vavraia culicis subsp. floridensis]|uniref:Uncharacterized protein n=1 Tax=Vavraia culicis (isolate floridensis) TaxID=948595 RepID=L2GV84_VAVCU|nr:uncharacterized protein VCUG_00965 [Vavraia culicis subsp. floridensis]ELA47534.1 hypothetical protein VCUG_00965 [Vavraia culicis subsp. floridensis]